MQGLSIDPNHVVNESIMGFRETDAVLGHLDIYFKRWRASCAECQLSFDLKHFG